MRNLKSILASALIFSAAFAPSAHAMLVSAFTSAGTYVICISVAGGAVLEFNPRYHAYRSRHDRLVTALLVGLIILDGKDSQKTSFAKLDESALDKLGLNDYELKSYNAHVAELNQIADAIDAEAGDKDLSKEQVQALQAKYQDAISALPQETRNVVQKIAAQN